jgi:hypothetical protein
MALDEGLSSFIGRLYEAVHDADAWRAMVGELLERTGSRLAFITTVDVRHREYSRAMFYGKEDSAFAQGVEEYQEEFYLADPSLSWASRHPNAGMCETEAIIPKNDYLKDPYIVWQKSRLGRRPARAGRSTASSSSIWSAPSGWPRVLRASPATANRWWCSTQSGE